MEQHFLHSTFAYLSLTVDKFFLPLVGLASILHHYLAIVVQVFVHLRRRKRIHLHLVFRLLLGIENFKR